jgi:hypothetical protein
MIVAALGRDAGVEVSERSALVGLEAEVVAQVLNQDCWPEAAPCVVPFHLSPARSANLLHGFAQCIVQINGRD